MAPLECLADVREYDLLLGGRNQTQRFQSGACTKPSPPEEFFPKNYPGIPLGEAQIDLRTGEIINEQTRPLYLIQMDLDTGKMQFVGLDYNGPPIGYDFQI